MNRPEISPNSLKLSHLFVIDDFWSVEAYEAAADKYDFSGESESRYRDRHVLRS